MESTLQTPALVVVKTTPNAKTIVYWIATALFCLQMGFTAYAQLSLPQLAEMFTHLGFPDYFRVELSWAKLLGVALLLAPVTARLKEWAYAGFVFDLAGAMYSGLAVGDPLAQWLPVLVVFGLIAVSYHLSHKRAETAAGLRVAL